MINVTRLYADATGESHFEDSPVNMEDKTNMGYNSVLSNAKSIQFVKIDPHHEWDFVTATDKMYAVIISGAIEIQTSDGEKRKFVEGNVVCFDDVSVRGHKAATFQNQLSCMVVHMA